MPVSALFPKRLKKTIKSNECLSPFYVEIIRTISLKAEFIVNSEYKPMKLPKVENVVVLLSCSTPKIYSPQHFILLCVTPTFNFTIQVILHS